MGLIATIDNGLFVMKDNLSIYEKQEVLLTKDDGTTFVIRDTDTVILYVDLIGKDKTSLSTRGVRTGYRKFEFDLTNLNTSLNIKDYQRVLVNVTVLRDGVTLTTNEEKYIEIYNRS